MPPPVPRSALSVADVRDVPVYIYGLADPTTGEIRYIGKSSNPEGRLVSHCSETGARRVREWTKSLGVPPRVVALWAILPGEDAAAGEREELARRLANGERLLNVQGVGARVTLQQLREQAASPVVCRIYGRDYPATRALQALANMLSICTQKDLERFTGCGQGQISRILRGRKPRSLAMGLRFERIGIDMRWWDQPVERKSEAA